MIYYLMHKDIKVLKLDISENGHILKLFEIINKDHMPFSTTYRLNKNDYSAFFEWWQDRSIPITRDEYENLTNSLQDNSLSVVIKAHALSLTDQYWVKKESESMTFDEISFFTNKFSNDLGDILVGKSSDSKINYYSPDSTSTGNLKKRWMIIDGKRVLLKAGSKPYQYEIFNEIIASKVMEELSIDHISYSFYKDKDDIYCASEDFISYNEDFVSAYQLRNYRKQKNNSSLFQHLLSVYNELNIPHFRTKLNQMLFVDYLLGNSDRHLNNFGVIRDAKTLEFLRVSPIYDTGACLGFDKKDSELKNLTDIEWKPFKNSKYKSQLMLIDDFSWLNVEKLRNIPQLIDSILINFKEYISESRKDAVLSFVSRRINDIYRHLNITKEIHYTGSYDLTLLEKKIYEIIKNEQIVSDLNSLAEKLSVSYITIYRTISSLTNKNLIQRKGSRKSGYWTI